MNIGIEDLDVGEQIGSGGFGVVYRAEDRAHGRNVAVKVLPPISDASARRRFDRERQAMGRLSGHPNIAVVHTSGFTAQDEPYIVMELLSGGSLADDLAQGPMPVDTVVSMGVDLADALTRAHELGVLHLDLKPANILMSDFGRPKIVDFGIAALADDEASTQTIRATPSYADPEFLDGKPPTERSDVYGLAATLYALLSGSAPYAGDTDSAMTVLRRVALDPVPLLDRADAPRELTELLAAAMAKHPDERPATMREFGDRLRGIRAGTTGEQPAVPPPSAAASSDDDNVTAVVAPLSAAAPGGTPAAPSPASPSQAPPSSSGAPGAPGAPSAATSGAAAAGASGEGRSTSPWLVGGVVVAVLALIGGLFVINSGDGESGPTADTAPAADTTAAENVTPVTEPAPSEDEPDDPPPATEPAPTSGVDGVDPPSTSALARSVVQVQLLRDGEPTCTGSGTIIEADGTILTNSHVIAQSAICLYDTIGVAITEDAASTPNLAYQADVLVDDPLLDIAVIRIARTLDGEPTDDEFPTVTVGSSDDVQLGDRIRVLGYPGIGGETITVTSGSVSGFASDAEYGERAWLKTDATIAGGNSGGLAVNEGGELIGVPTIVGSGSSEVTDCRIITDTNGDGFVDENDTCVPTGGFINGIRPVDLATDAIAAAATATPVRPELPEIDPPAPPETTPAEPEQPVAPLPVVTGGVWTLALDESGFPTAPTAVVPDGSTQLCLTWDYVGSPIGVSNSVDWFIDGVFEPNPSFLGTTTVVDGSFFACITNNAGLPVGLYEVVWSIDGFQVFTAAIYVGGGRGQMDVTVVNSTGSTICSIYVTPTASGGIGLNQLFAPIGPGEEGFFSIASGDYRTLVFDCNNVLLFEDPGTVITNENNVLTVGG